MHNGHPHTWWWEAEREQTPDLVIDYVAEVERVQSHIFERFIRLDCLYDPYGYYGEEDTLGGPFEGRRTQVSENVIASNVDTVAAVVAATEVRARLVTDQAEWSAQRRAKHLEWYAEGLSKLCGVQDKSRRAFKDAALKGTGLIKVVTDAWDRICVERVLVDDIVVDEAETRSGAPRQMHQRKFVDREALKAAYPDYALEIDNAQTGDSERWRYWADCRELDRDQLVVIESWRLPIGEKGHEGYKPGRHTIVIDGVALVYEDWEKPFFPFARLAWSERMQGWYACGLAERIVGHQRQLNKLHWQVDRQLDHHAVPTTWVKKPDAKIAVQSVNRLGTIGVYKAEKPETVIPPAVSGETYNRLERVKEGSYEESGMSRMFANSRKPPGLESGAALREYRDQTTQRFAQQERAYEQFILDIVWLILDCAKDLGEKAPEVYRRTRFKRRKIKWEEVKMDEARVQLTVANSLSRTPAGRYQLVLEMAQAGLISQDDARRLIDPGSTLDVAQTLSLYTAAIDNLEATFEEILDGEQIAPEPYQNLKMGVWRGQMYLLEAQTNGAPEDVIQQLEQWITQAVWMQERPQDWLAAEAGMGQGAMQPQGQSGPALPEAAMPALPGGPPSQAAPAPSVAPEAIGAAGAL